MRVVAVTKSVGLEETRILLELGQAKSDLDRSLFRLSRFEEGKPIAGRYEYSIAG